MLDIWTIIGAISTVVCAVCAVISLLSDKNAE